MEKFIEVCITRTCSTCMCTCVHVLVVRQYFYDEVLRRSFTTKSSFVPFLAPALLFVVLDQAQYYDTFDQTLTCSVSPVDDVELDLQSRKK